ncbi:uncharacterized protein N7483_012731 [Penicillium malachiteum]|uniref:uncharacterized protein n=1 Tax=Penicillium malachiteum TaxID=1324776 RepID=UPI0025466B3F|nr:uncharacterized protein N7483_012731 [Penicillium malachiteum]KAJ5715550.1 hypothetical protein N7483_012731 [Penicillium malachiteum]
MFRDNTISVEQSAQSLLGRIEERDAIVKAWAYLGGINHVLLYTEFVLSQARALDQVPYEERGPLHGPAIGVKDIMSTKGITHGSLDQ